LPHPKMLPDLLTLPHVDVPVASWECTRCCIIGILIDHWPKHHAVGHLLPPDFQTPLQRADETVWIEPGIFRLQTFKELPASSFWLSFKPTS
jgi:hypothetical protein